MDTTLRKSIHITANPEKIWHVLTDETAIRQRCTPFSPGTYATTTWEQGSDITRATPAGICMKGRITTYDKPHKIVTTFYEGDAQEGFRDELKDTIESYEIVADDQGATLNIMSGPLSEQERSEYSTMMNTMRDEALGIVKHLAEESH